MMSIVLGRDETPPLNYMFLVMQLHVPFLVFRVVYNSHWLCHVQLFIDFFATLNYFIVNFHGVLHSCTT